MLILLVTVTILVSLLVEIFIHLFRDSYEIVWPEGAVLPENALALEVADKLRKAAAKMNGK